MRAVVLKDAGLAKRAGQFAWLSIDTDRPANEAFNARFPSTGVPLFLIIDPKTEKALISWYGTASAEQLGRLLDDGLAAGKPKKPGSPEALLAGADALNVAGKLTEAGAAYMAALKAGGRSWARYSRAAESMMLAYELSGDRAGGTRAALEVAPTLARDQSFVNVMRVGIQSAASEVETTVDGSKQFAPVPAHLAILKPLAIEALAVPGGFADDKAMIYSALLGIERKAGNEAGIKRTAQEMWDFLARAADASRSAEVRSSLSGFMRSAAMDLDDVARMAPIYEALEKELPQDYGPPQALASLYLQLGRPGDALAAYKRAYERARGEGVKAAQILMSCASLQVKLGDRAGAKASLDQMGRLVESLPEPQAARYRTQIKTLLDKLGG